MGYDETWVSRLADKDCIITRRNYTRIRHFQVAVANPTWNALNI